MAKLTSSMPVFAQLLGDSLDAGSFVKLSLGNYQGSEKELKQIHVREILIKGSRMLSFTYRYQTKDITKNYGREEALAKVMAYIENGFRTVNLFTTIHQLTFDLQKSGEWTLHTSKSAIKAAPSLQHDHEKGRLISSGPMKTYLHELGLTDAAGKVYKNAQDKYKQINQYVALLKPMIEEIGFDEIREVVDMGSGKGYLTFALYDYLSQAAAHPVAVTGVEYREDLVTFCNRVAQRSGFDRLVFRQGAIGDYPEQSIDMLIALHACDTATDDALYKGIQAGTRLIVVAPCCHKQIRKEMERHRLDHLLQPLTRYGIFLERQAEMLTDAIRALLLEYHGYKTKIFEFISDAHTPKNVMLTGVKTTVKAEQKEKIAQQIKELKATFGIEAHYLEKLLGMIL